MSSRTSKDLERVSAKTEVKQKLDHQQIIAEALKIYFPSWPLQTNVAVNPFWKFRQSTFKSTFLELRPVLRQDLYMPIQWYLGLYKKNEITEKSLRQALHDSEWELSQTLKSLDELFLVSSTQQFWGPEYLTFAEYCDKVSGTEWQREFNLLISRFCASYFDDLQALAQSPFKGDGFWKGLLQFLKYDKTLAYLGISKSRDYITEIENLDAAIYIQHVLRGLDLENASQKIGYLRRIGIQLIGWASRFEYDTWQENLGETPTQYSKSIELLAAGVALDQLLRDRFGKEQNPALVQDWIQHYLSTQDPKQSSAHPCEVLHIWQTALEYSRQDFIAKSIQSNLKSLKSLKKETAPSFQIAMCIDVRSETIRYHLEQQGELDTIGVAGFFGVGISYKKIIESKKTARLPALLKSQYPIEETLKLEKRHPHQQEKMGQLRGYLRNLRKASFSSFLYVETLGAYTVFQFMQNLWNSTKNDSQPGKVPSKFDDSKSFPCVHHEKLGLDTQVSIAQGFLKSISYPFEKLGRIFVVAGHGSHTTNNHLGSALDCGACGGNAGDINARVLVTILNNTSVRKQLADQNIKIPSRTYFVAAVHETVTNEIYLLDQTKTPESHQEDQKQLLAKLQAASIRYREQLKQKPGCKLDPNSFRRAKNWSETRPEWGLNDNSSFIIAPRTLTKNTPLNGQSFLHEYNADKDPEFNVLEQILMGPMVVTNWINLQYFASTVAPKVYGAGNKTIHNLVCENGVLEGSSGDLKAGLTLQSLHDGDHWMHTPARLSVYIAAPIEAIENLIAKHDVLSDLINKEWLYILRIDSDTGDAFLRLGAGKYRPCLNAVSWS